MENYNSQNNMNVDIESVISSPKPSLDKIYESLKFIKEKNYITEDLQAAIKILKRFKLIESCKW
jgi:hypothetical protein